MHICCPVCGTHYCYLCRRLYPLSRNPSGRELHDLMVRSSRIHLYRSFALGMDQMRCLEGADPEVDKTTKLPDYEAARRRMPELWTLLNLNHADRFSHNTPPFYFANCPQYMFDVTEDELHRDRGMFSGGEREKEVMRALGEMRRKWKLTEEEQDVYDVDVERAEVDAREKGMQMMYKLLIAVHRFYSIIEDRCERERTSTAFLDACCFFAMIQSGFHEALEVDTSVEQLKRTAGNGWNAVTALGLLGREYVSALYSVMIMSGTPLALLDVFAEHGPECVEAAHSWCIYTYAGVAKPAAVPKMLRREHRRAYMSRSLEDQCRRHSLINVDEVEQEQEQEQELDGVSDDEIQAAAGAAAAPALAAGEPASASAGDGERDGDRQEVADA